MTLILLMIMLSLFIIVFGAVIGIILVDSYFKLLDEDFGK